MLSISKNFVNVFTVQKLIYFLVEFLMFLPFYVYHLHLKYARLLGKFGGQLLVPTLITRLFFLTVLLFILFTPKAQIINALKSSRLHGLLGLMVSMRVNPKITSVFNSREIWGPNVFSCVMNFYLFLKYIILQSFDSFDKSVIL